MKNFGPYIKAMAKIQGKDILPDVKMPRKPRAKETKPRREYSHPERKFRREAIKFLRRKGCIVYLIENGVQGNNGIPDLLVFRYDKMFWLELKSTTGRLSGEQVEFQNYCLRAAVKHIVAREIKDLYQITGDIQYDRPCNLCGSPTCRHKDVCQPEA